MDPLVESQDLPDLRGWRGILDSEAERVPQDLLDLTHKQVRLDLLDLRVQPAGPDPRAEWCSREQVVVEEIQATQGPPEAAVLGVSQAFGDLQG